MRILVFTGHWIGDAVLSTGVIAALIERHPEARLTIVCGPTAAPLFAATPNIERLIPMARERRSRHWLRLWGRLVGTKWDLGYDFRGTALLYAMHVGKRFPRLRRHRFGHMVEQYARFAQLDRVPAPKLWTAPHHREESERLVPEGSPVLALGPIASWPGKEWPPDCFAALLDRLMASSGILSGARVAVFGDTPGRQRVAPLLDRIPPKRLIDLIGAVDLLTAAACLRRCALFIGNDSGTMHLAAASGVPTLGLFGPSRETMFGPWGELCSVVRTPQSFDEIVDAPGYDHRSTNIMHTLSVDAAEAAAKALWDRCGEWAA